MLFSFELRNRRHCNLIPVILLGIGFFALLMLKSWLRPCMGWCGGSPPLQRRTSRQRASLQLGGDEGSQCSMATDARLRKEGVDVDEDLEIRQGRGKQTTPVEPFVWTRVGRMRWLTLWLHQPVVLNTFPRNNLELGYMFKL